ncbi:MAG TPA: hypothetical protein ENJ95_17735 [Bacteroidetes bacterium]|nr:hypothetical protein [Bacteroidota bacterium]
MKIIKLFLQLFFLSVALSFSNHCLSQCTTWQKLNNADELMDSYVIYRGYMKKGNIEKAFPYWEEVYNNAPAADGKRGHVYSDGRVFYFEKYKAEKRRSKKKEIANTILRLYEEEKKCYPNNEIDLPPKEVIDFLNK